MTSTPMTNAQLVAEVLRLRESLIEAMKVVKAAQAYKDDDGFDDTDSLNKLLNAVEQWEAGK